MAGFTAQFTRARYTGHTAQDEQCQLYVPDDHLRDNTKRGIIFIHGAGGSYRQGGSGASGSPFEAVFQPIVNTLRLPILSIDCGGDGSVPITVGGAASAGLGPITGGPDTWGNPQSVATLANAVAWATGASAAPFSYADRVPGFKSTGGVILLGWSQGAGIAHNFAARYPALVKALVLVTPAVNLDYLYANNIGGYAASIDRGFDGATTGAPVVAGTAGATNWQYRIVPVTDAGDGTSTPSATFAGVALGSLGATPNTVTWGMTAGVTFLGSSSNPRGHKIVRSADGGATWNTIDTIGAGVLSTTISAAGTTALPVAALPYAIPSGTTLLLVAHDWTTTQVVTTTALAAAGATSIAVTSFTPSTGYMAGSRLFPTRYVDTGVAAGAVYTPVASPWTTNGKNASPSYNPLNYVPAAIQAIPQQLWWSAGDTTVDTGAAPGAPGTHIQAYKNAYGANCSLQELSGAPAHGNAWVGFNNANLPTLLNFLAANA